MITQSRTIWAVLLALGLVLLAVFVGAGYGMILLPLGFILLLLLLGAASSMFGSR